jgi:hypothetical protein
VLDPDSVLSFDKSAAKPESITEFPRFLDRDIAAPGEAADLLGKALISATLLEQATMDEKGDKKQFEAPAEAVPEEHFPPCIRLILRGLPDGKKRALFILTNFLSSCGWPPEMIDVKVREWNEKNPEKLREVVIKTHMSIKSRKTETIMPPNCSSDYYRAIGVCQPDDFCRTIKNPAQYALKRQRMVAFRRDGKLKVKREPLTEEQKEMRRAYRKKNKPEDNRPAENAAQDSES